MKVQNVVRTNAQGTNLCTKTYTNVSTNVHTFCEGITSSVVELGSHLFICPHSANPGECIQVGTEVYMHVHLCIAWQQHLYVPVGYISHEQLPEVTTSFLISRFVAVSTVGQLHASHQVIEHKLFALGILVTVPYFHLCLFGKCLQSFWADDKLLGCEHVGRRGECRLFVFQLGLQFWTHGRSPQSLFV